MIRKFRVWCRRWKQLDFNEYLDEIKYEKFLYIFFAWLPLYVLYPKFENIITDNFINNNFNSKSIYWQYIYTIILFFCFHRFSKKISKNLFPPFKYLIFYLATFITIILVKFSSNIDYLTFNYFNLFQLSFINSFFLIIFLYTIPFKNYIRPQLNKIYEKFSLIDDFSNTNDIDLLIRGKFISSVVKHIKNTETNNSFSIGIVGKWGNGKTNVLNRIMNSLSNSDKNIIIELNPWKPKGLNEIIESFFKKLEENLTQYDSSFFSLINRYYESILDENTPNEYLNYFLKIFKIQKNKKNDIESINNLISKSKKKIIVFIDDIDRLNGFELIDLFSFIRNTANFRNTFFIVPYDKNYISNVLIKTNQFHNEEEYLKKIIQLEIVIPDFKKSFYISEIKKYLLNGFENTSLEYQLINDSINKIAYNQNWIVVENESATNNNLHENIFEILLLNIRDLKRFCNSVRIIIENTDFEADLSELIILELIKNYDYNSYTLISSKQILKFKDFTASNNFDEQFELNSEVFNNQVESGALNPYIRNVIYKLFDNRNNDKTSRSIIYTRNFYLYFSYQLFEKISLKEFKFLINSRTNTIISKFHNWLNLGAENELFTIISDENFNSKLSFFKALNKSILLLEEQLEWRWVDHIIERLTSKYSLTLFQNNIKKRREYILDLINEKSINPYVRAYIIKSIWSSDNNFCNTIFYKNKIISLFNEYTKTNDISNYRLERFLLMSYESKNNKIIPHKAITDLYREILIKSPLVFVGFMKMFLRIEDNGVRNGTPFLKLKFNPFVRFIFPDISIFYKMLNNLNNQDEEIKHILQIISENINYDFENPNPIEITDNNTIYLLNKIINQNSQR